MLSVVAYTIIDNYTKYHTTPQSNPNYRIVDKLIMGRISKNIDKLSQQQNKELSIEVQWSLGEE
jgi:hypothetical protein